MGTVTFENTIATPMETSHHVSYGGKYGFQRDPIIGVEPLHVL